MMKRRDFFKKTAITGGVLLTAPGLRAAAGNKKDRDKEAAIIGHGAFRYRVIHDWGTQDPSVIPVDHCHEMVQDAKKRLIMCTTDTHNNIIIYDKSGKVLHTWGREFPGAHGLTITDEGGEEFLFITDTDRHRVFKTTLDGKIIMTLEYPRMIADYEKEEQFKPTEVAVAPNGDFYIADGYGLSYVIQYDYQGKYIRHFGGKGKAEHNLDTAHGVWLDERDTNNPLLLVTSRSAQEFKRFTLDGQYLSTQKLPGSWICRPRTKGENLYFAVIVTKSWFNYDGCIMVLDKDDKVVSLPGASAPEYEDGVLKEPQSDRKSFMNPHDVCIDDEENLYIPQWYSGRTYPVKLERI